MNKQYKKINTGEENKKDRKHKKQKYVFINNLVHIAKGMK